MGWLRRFLWIAAAVAGVYIYFAAFHPHEKIPEHPFFSRPGPWVIAHRAGRGLWPENTLYALERALELGVDVLEMDLRATSDGVIVVLHDDTVDRTTNGTGRVADMTFSATRRLDAGYRFDDGSGAYPFRGRGLTVPALADVLSRLPGALLNLEMKEFSPALAVELCRLIRIGAAAGRVLVASFGHDAMAAFRRACPSVATSATAREVVALHALHRAGLASLFRSPAVALQTPENAGGRTIAESSFLDLARRRNVRMHVWTINDEAQMKRLLDLGVHGIMTDYPDRLLRVMGRGRPLAESLAPGSRPSSPTGHRTRRNRNTVVEQAANRRGHDCPLGHSPRIRRAYPLRAEALATRWNSIAARGPIQSFQQRRGGCTDKTTGRGAACTLPGGSPDAIA